MFSNAIMNYVTENVISKVQCDLVDNEELEETVIRKLQANWKRKMCQAGLISDMIEISSASIPQPATTPLQTPDSSPLLENADITDQLNSFNDFLVSAKGECDNVFNIPQKDGANDGDVVTEPEIHASNDEKDDEVLNEDDDEVSNDDDEILNKTIGDETGIKHFVVCQFVKRIKNKWNCKLKSGVMEINGRNKVFSEADGFFIF